MAKKLMPKGKPTKVYAGGVTNGNMLELLRGDFVSDGKKKGIVWATSGYGPDNVCVEFHNGIKILAYIRSKHKLKKISRKEFEDYIQANGYSSFYCKMI